MVIAIAAFLLVLALGGAGYVFAGAGGDRSQKRVAQVAKQSAQLRGNTAGDTNALKRKNVQQLLKQIESKSAEQKTMTMRKRLDQAGLPDVSVRTFWLASAGLGLVVALVCFNTKQPLIVDVLAAFGAGLGLPRWLLGFMKARREKKFTNEFANAIDVVVRSVRSGLPTNEAL